jgi:hypothetical protein
VYLKGPNLQVSICSIIELGVEKVEFDGGKGLSAYFWFLK